MYGAKPRKGPSVKIFVDEGQCLINLEGWLKSWIIRLSQVQIFHRVSYAVRFGGS